MIVIVPGVVLLIYHRLKTFSKLGPRYTPLQLLKILKVKLHKIKCKYNLQIDKLNCWKLAVSLFITQTALFLFAEKRDNFQGQIFQYSLIYRCTYFEENCKRLENVSSSDLNLDFRIWSCLFCFHKICETNKAENFLLVRTFL